LKDFIGEAKVLAKIPPSPYVVRLVGICSEPFCILTVKIIKKKKKKKKKKIKKIKQND